MNYDDLARQLRRDEAARQRLIQRAARHGCIAFDADEMEQLSAKELAKKILAKMGIKPESDNPVAELMTYFEGREASARGREGIRESGGMDAESRGSFVDDYINGR